MPRYYSRRARGYVRARRSRPSSKLGNLIISPHFTWNRKKFRTSRVGAKAIIKRRNQFKRKNAVRLYQQLKKQNKAVPAESKTFILDQVYKATKRIDNLTGSQCVEYEFCPFESQSGNPTTDVTPNTFVWGEIWNSASGNIADYCQQYDYAKIKSITITITPQATDTRSYRLLYRYLQDIPSVYDGGIVMFDPSTVTEQAGVASRMSSTQYWHSKIINKDKPIQLYYKPWHYPDNALTAVGKIGDNTSAANPNVTLKVISDVTRTSRSAISTDIITQYEKANGPFVYLGFIGILQSLVDDKTSKSPTPPPPLHISTKYEVVFYGRK